MYFLNSNYFCLNSFCFTIFFHMVKFYIDNKCTKKPPQKQNKYKKQKLNIVHLICFFITLPRFCTFFSRRYNKSSRHVRMCIPIYVYTNLCAYQSLCYSFKSKFLLHCYHFTQSVTDYCKAIKYYRTRNNLHTTNSNPQSIRKPAVFFTKSYSEIEN